MLLLSLGLSATELVQEIPLQAGWNAVWLEVTPAEPAVAAIFGGTPVDQIAAFFPSASTVQFVTDPDTAVLNRPEWGVWYAPSRPEAALNNLTIVGGGRAYLVHALSAATVTVRGTPYNLPLRWFPNSLNFVGLPVDPEAPPTFAEFFAQSAAHLSMRIYRLSDGRWRPLSSPATTTVVRGVAYWIYCTGRSDWQGPLEASIAAQGSVNLTDTGFTCQLQVRNHSGGPLAAALLRLAGDLPLHARRLDAGVDAPDCPLSSGQSLGALPAGRTATLQLEVRREQMSAGEQETLLSVCGGGCLNYISVKASRGTP
jgi:hypothetical protein